MNKHASSRKLVRGDIVQTNKYICSPSCSPEKLYYDGGCCVTGTDVCVQDTCMYQELEGGRYQTLVLQ